MTNVLTLFHGSPVKIRIGEYLNPEFCGMWENSKIYNPQTDKYDIKATYFIGNFDVALFYARREIYAPEDVTTGTKYFIFNRPNHAIYVYEVKVPRDILYTAMGQRATNFDSEVCAIQPVKIVQRHTYNIARILEHFGNKEKINTAARIIKKNAENCINGEFIAPFSFGLPGGMGFVHFDNKQLIQDLKENTILAPGIPMFKYKQR